MVFRSDWLVISRQVKTRTGSFDLPGWTVKSVAFNLPFRGVVERSGRDPAQGSRKAGEVEVDREPAKGSREVGEVEAAHRRVPGY